MAIPTGLLFLVFVAAIQHCTALYLTRNSFTPCSYTYEMEVQVLDCSYKSLAEVPSVDPAMPVSAFLLDGNPITSIGPNAFANLSRSLQLLTVSSSTLMERIDNAAFTGLTALTTLSVEGKVGSEKSMNKVNIGALLAGLASLSNLRMKNININELPARFASGTSLTNISLVRTAIATVNLDAFISASKLRVLDMSYNLLNTGIENMNWLRYALSLETAQCVMCGITSAYLGQIPSLPKLYKLDLGNNLLDSLAENSLANVAASLSELSLVYNDISETKTQGLAALSALKKLAMLGNGQLSNIPAEIKQLEALEQLDLRQTKISGVQADAFHSSSQLRMLKLDFTNVHFLHAQAFAKLKNLEEFTLSSGGLSSAVILDTEGRQQPGNWSIILAQVPRLQTLSLSGTQEANGGLTNAIWSSVQLLPRLRKLYLDYNAITTVPDFYLFSFVNLTDLSLQGNSIARVTSAAFYGTNSLQMKLQNNQLMVIDNCTFSMLSNLNQVSLEANPFTCNCAMQWLWQRLKLDVPLILQKITCSQPASLTNRTWDTLSFSSFCAPGEMPPSNCSVQSPVMPTALPNSFLLNITVSRVSSSNVRLQANVLKYAKIFSGYAVTYWPVLRPQAVMNTTIFPISAAAVTLQIGENEVYRFCYVLLMNDRNLSLIMPENCRDFTLTGLVNSAAIAIGVLAAIIGTAIVFAVICLLCKKLRKKDSKGSSDEEDPYIYTYPDEKQIGKQAASSHGNQGNGLFQATLRPESKRYSKRSRTNLAGSRPSLATSTTTLAASRISSPGFAIQNGARPVSGHSVMQQNYHRNPMLLVQPSQSMHSIAENRPMGPIQQQISRSQDQLSDPPSNLRIARMLPPPPRHALSQELVLDVTRVQSSDGRYLPQGSQLQQPPLPLPLPPRQRLMSANAAQDHQPPHHLDSTVSLADHGGYSDGYVPMSAGPSNQQQQQDTGLGESSTDDFRQPPLPLMYNTYLQEEQFNEAMQYPESGQKFWCPQEPSNGVDNSAFQRSDTSGYYEMGQF